MNFNSSNPNSNKILFHSESAERPLHFENQKYSNQIITHGNQQEKQRNINQQLDNFFWKTNHYIENTFNSSAQICLEPFFEEELMKEHLVVIKVELFTYFSHIHEDINQSNIQMQPNSDLYQNQFDKLANSNIFIEKLINSQKNQSEFKELQIQNLNNILNKNPFNFKIFQAFSEGVPEMYKQKLFYIIYKGFQLQQKLNLEHKGRSNKQLYQFVQENYSALELNHLMNKNSTQFEKIARVVLYTTISLAQGRAQNIFYKQSLAKKQYQFLLTSRLWNFGKRINFIEKNKKKKQTIVRLSSLKLKNNPNNISKKRKISSE